MKSLIKIEFEAECIAEGSWGSRDLGKRKCSMELFDNENGRAEIEFIAGDDCQHIGLTYDSEKNILDYDGVFSMPNEAIELLNKAGFNTKEIE